jgi:hypothetical protein
MDVEYRYGMIREWVIIASFYGDKRAERSQVPLIQHIKEGVAVLDHLGASNATIKAFMLHPLFQSDKDLAKTATRVGSLLPLLGQEVVLLVMEYRNQANAWLSDKVENHCIINSRGERVVEDFRLVGMPTPGPLPEVRLMLIADKVQNYKDFLAHHHGKHERSDELERYFQAWFKALGVTHTQWLELHKVMADVK